VPKRITGRGPIVGTRRDFDEAIAFAAEGKVRAEITKAQADINAIFERMKAGKIDGRMVLNFG
jgi:propanol-preferring alcohol dehydrogenase